MNNYNEKIKSKEEQINKLQEEINIRKAKISKLQTEIKQIENAKDAEFSRDFLKKMSEFGFTSDDDRKEVLNKIEDLALEREIAKSEKNNKMSESSKDEESIKTNILGNHSTVKNT